MKQERLFKPGPTFRRRFQLVERGTFIPTRRVRLTRQELLYLLDTGSLPSRGIAGFKERKRYERYPRT